MLVQCAICGKKFKPRTIRQICCSVECGYERQKEKSRLKPKKPKFKKTCAKCGVEFESSYSRQKYCSECGKKGVSKPTVQEEKPPSQKPTQLERLHAELLRRRRQREYDQMFKELERMGLQ